MCKAKKRFSQSNLRTKGFNAPKCFRPFPPLGTCFSHATSRPHHTAHHTTPHRLLLSPSSKPKLQTPKLWIKGGYVKSSHVTSHFHTVASRLSSLLSSGVIITKSSHLKASQQTRGASPNERQRSQRNIDISAFNDWMEMIKNQSFDGFQWLISPH